MGMCRRVARVKHVVVEAVLLRSTGRCPRRPCRSWRGKCGRNARRICWRRLRRRCLRARARWPWPACRGNTWPSNWCASDCSTKLPGPSGVERSNTPILSSPRKPPWKTFLPFDVLAIDPPGEIDQQLVKHALEKFAIRSCPERARQFCKRARPPRRARADSRRRNSIRRRAIRRWDACTIRAKRESS